MINIKFKPLGLAALAVFAFSCTDLDIEEQDSILIEDEAGEFTGVPAEAALTSAYGDLRGFGDQANLYALLEVTSDELLVPTRGVDWGDNGQWRSLHLQNWNATHPFLISTWNSLNGNIYRLNQIIDPATDATPQQRAEARFLRAYNMFLVLDLWGQVPFREATDPINDDPEVFTGAQAVEFILNDLNEALPNLPALSPGPQTRQASKASANFLLAKVLLNKHIYLGNETAAEADLQKVIESVNAIQADGFQLEDGYFEIFEESADTETIFWTNTAVGNRIWNGLHYNQPSIDNGGGGWNGFSTTADFYALFEGPTDTNAKGAGQEERRGYVPGPDDIEAGDPATGYGFLVGQQYGMDGQPLQDRRGGPLAYTKQYRNNQLVGQGEVEGIRIIKYNPFDGPNDEGSFREHYILFRYADAHLMKAEAYARLGQLEQARELVNELRALRKASLLDASEFNLMEILDERGRELYIEGWRRNDQIRFGTFTDAAALKDEVDETRTRFPIPVTAVTSNPNLEQNPGY